jgi:hypothetical protein
VQVDAPAKPSIPAGTLLLTAPYVFPVRSHRHGIGWQDRERGGPCFVVVRIRAIGDKILESFPLTDDGWAQAWAALVKLDPGAAQAVAKVVEKRLAVQAAEKATQAAEAERQAQVYEAFASAEDATVFQWLGVQVLVGDGTVYSIGSHNDAAKASTSRLLGPLAGAQAVVTDGSQAWSPGRAMFLPVGLTGLATKTKADAVVVLPDGTVHTAPLDGNYAVREAQKQVVQFNAMAGTAAPAAPQTGSDPVVRLRKLQELLDAGLLTQDEYETKRAKIIDSI